MHRSDTDDARKSSEREFHDAVFADGARGHLARVYDAMSASRSRYRDRIVALAPGARVLEYGCGTGSHAFLLASSAESVTGIDISPVAVDMARQKQSAAGLSNVQFEVMDAEHLRFPAASFDLVCGTAILHHLDLGQSYAEVRRVLRPGGRAVFLEPFAYHPIIAVYRLATPRLRTPDEHPLRRGDLALARSTFGGVESRHYNFLTVFLSPVAGVRAFQPVIRLLERIDAAVLAGSSPLRWLGWQAVLEFTP